MLSKRKKRIAALLTAVVLFLIAAFSLPENIRAEECLLNSDADAKELRGRRVAGRIRIAILSEILASWARRSISGR